MRYRAEDTQKSCVESSEIYKSHTYVEETHRNRCVRAGLLKMCTKSFVRAGDSQKSCVRAGDSQNSQNHSYEQEIHRNHAYEREIHKWCVQNSCVRGRRFTNVTKIRRVSRRFTNVKRIHAYEQKIHRIHSKSCVRAVDSQNSSKKRGSSRRFTRVRRFTDFLRTSRRDTKVARTNIAFMCTS